MNSNNWKAEIEQEIKALEASYEFSPVFRKKKLITYSIRTMLTLAIFCYFWEQQWVRWVILIYIPLNLFILRLIILTPDFLKKRIEKLKSEIDSVEAEN